MNVGLTLTLIACENYLNTKKVYAAADDDNGDAGKAYICLASAKQARQKKIDVLWTEVSRMVNMGQKYQKRGIAERKRAKIENPCLNAHVHINMNLHI